MPSLTHTNQISNDYRLQIFNDCLASVHSTGKVIWLLVALNRRGWQSDGKGDRCIRVCEFSIGCEQTSWMAAKSKGRPKFWRLIWNWNSLAGHRAKSSWLVARLMDYARGRFLYGISRCENDSKNHLLAPVNRPNRSISTFITGHGLGT